MLPFCTRQREVVASATIRGPSHGGLTVASMECISCTGGIVVVSAILHSQRFSSVPLDNLCDRLAHARSGPPLKPSGRLAIAPRSRLGHRDVQRSGRVLGCIDVTLPAHKACACEVCAVDASRERSLRTPAIADLRAARKLVELDIKLGDPTCLRLGVGLFGQQVAPATSSGRGSSPG